MTTKAKLSVAGVLLVEQRFKRWKEREAQRESHKQNELRERVLRRAIPHYKREWARVEATLKAEGLDPLTDQQRARLWVAALDEAVAKYGRPASYKADTFVGTPHNFLLEKGRREA